MLLYSILLPDMFIYVLEPVINENEVTFSILIVNSASTSSILVAQSLLKPYNEPSSSQFNKNVELDMTGGQVSFD